MSIERSIDFCIFNSLRHIFNADYKACFLRNKIGDCARARVKVVDKFITGELGKFTCHLIKFVGLLRISLIKALRPHLEAQTFHLFVDKISTTIGDDIQISYCIVTLCVIDIKQGGDFGERLVQEFHHHQCIFTLFVGGDAKLYEQHDFSS